MLSPRKKTSFEYKFDVHINDLLFRVLISDDPFGRTDNFTFLPHNHSRYELHYVMDGQLYIHTDKMDYIACKSDVCIIHPYEYHTFLKSVDDRVSTAAVVSFYIEQNASPGGGGIDTRLAKKILDKTYTFHDEAGAMGILFERIKIEFDNKRPGYLISANALVTSLLVCLVQDLCLQQPVDTDHAFFQRMAERELIVEDYFMYNYMNSPTIDELAAHLHLCTRRVSQLIQQLYGCSFTQKLNRTRIEIAKLRLLYSSHTISEISVMCGFNSLNYFFTTFRKITGMSPKEYRLTTQVPFANSIKY